MTPDQLSALRTELQTQDNACTADPLFEAKVLDRLLDDDRELSIGGADKLLKQEQAAQCDGYDGPCESMEAKERKCRTAYNWDGAGQNPNRTPMLCDECAQAYDEYWNEMWAQAR